MKTAIITGCNRGLGKALMETYARNGYQIIAIIRHENEEFDSVAANLSSQYDISVHSIYAELSDENSLKQAIEKIEKMECPIDVLINNAAICITKPIFYMDYEEVEKSFRTNYFAPFLLTKKVSELMIRQGYGNIINITSVAGFAMEPGGSAYDASKTALNTLTKSVAQELAPFGIRVNAVACSVIDTDMYQRLKLDVQKKILKRIALKRPAKFEEITNYVLYLSSDEASYITGQIIRIDGGYAV